MGEARIVDQPISYQEGSLLPDDISLAIVSGLRWLNGLDMTVQSPNSLKMADGEHQPVIPTSLRILERAEANKTVKTGEFRAVFAALLAKGKKEGVFAENDWTFPADITQKLRTAESISDFLDILISYEFDLKKLGNPSQFPTPLEVLFSVQVHKTIGIISEFLKDMRNRPQDWARQEDMEALRRVSAPETKKLPPVSSQWLMEVDTTPMSNALATKLQQAVGITIEPESIDLEQKALELIRKEAAIIMVENDYTPLKNGNVLVVRYREVA